MRVVIFYAAHYHDQLYIFVKYHDYIPNNFQVMEQDAKLHLKQSKGNNSESMKTRVVNLVCGISL